MPIIYKRAVPEDIDILTEMRNRVLIAANKLPPDTDMSEIRRKTHEYYKSALAQGSHIAYLAYDEDRIAGTGGISFYRVMPTYHNPSGYYARIMNMYTDPAYRRKGVAFGMLDRLVREARSRGITVVSLEATEMGRPLYAKDGFVGGNDEMYLPEDIFQSKNTFEEFSGK